MRVDLCCSFSLAALTIVAVAALEAQNQPPTVIAAPANVALQGNVGTSQSLILDTVFADPDLLRLDHSQARISTTIGTMNVELFDPDAPATVQNFLRYVGDGRYANVFWHRSVPGFVIQTGGYSFANNSVGSVATYPPIANEFHRSNIRGTVAMAKLGGDPNSATSQWFVNLIDNSANLDAQNGGFTVFGRMIEGGMAVADSLAGLPVFNAGTPFDSLPLMNYGGGPILSQNLVYLTGTSVGPAMRFSATAADASVVSPVIQGLTLTLLAGRTGSTSVTLTATDFNGLSTQTSVQVSVTNPPRLVSVEHGPLDTLVTFLGSPNTAYAIEYLDDLSGSPWQTLQSSLLAAGDGSLLVTDQPPGGRRFYRARQLP